MNIGHWYTVVEAPSYISTQSSSTGLNGRHIPTHSLERIVLNRHSNFPDVYFRGLKKTNLMPLVHVTSFRFVVDDTELT